jgi:hypothetical protein
MTYSTKKAADLIFNLHIKYCGMVNAKEADIITQILLQEMCRADKEFVFKEVNFLEVQENVMQRVKDYCDAHLKRMAELRAIGGLTNEGIQDQTGIKINRDF